MVETVTTPRPGSAGHVGDLSTEVHRLWATEPSAAPGGRERLFVELNEIDVQLHRLTLRAVAAGDISERDRELVSSCAKRLDRLKRSWFPEDQPIPLGVG